MLQDRYTIIGVMGIGGMGSVYQARDMRFAGAQRICAVKEMIGTADAHLQGIIRRNFEREANILASLNHPAIPQVYDYFSQDERSYLVLEFIHGRDLEALLNDTADLLPEDQVRAWAIQICEVLAYLHQHQPQPIVFRDLKPSNIMLDQRERIRLVDFGIAKMFEYQVRGTMIGTEGYAPPEQYRGQVGPQGDLYALGATMHHLLTRRDPREEPPFSFGERPIRQLNPAVSSALVDVIEKALAYEPGERFASAEEMKAALLAVSVPVEPASETVAGGMAWAPSSPTKVADSAKGNGKSNQIVPIWAFRCEDEVRSTPAMHNGSVIAGAYDNNLYALRVEDGQLQWKFSTNGGMASSPYIWQEIVLVGSEDHGVYAVHARTGRLIWSYRTEGRVRASVRAAYSHAFVGSDDSYLYAINLQSGRVAWRFQAGGPVRSTPAVGDELLYFGSEDGYVHAIDMRGQLKWRFRSRRGITSSPRLQTGSIYVGSQDGTVYSLAAQTGWAVWQYRTNKPIISSPAIADHLLFIGTVEGQMLALELQSGRLVWKYDTEGQVTSSPCVHNGAVYFGGVDGHVYSLDARSGSLRWRFRTEGPVTSSPAISERGVVIGSSDHYVYALPF